MLGGTPPAIPPVPGPPVPAPAATTRGWKEKLHGALMELSLAPLADAVAHSVVSEAGGELKFQTPRDFRISMKEAGLRKAKAN